MKILIFSETVEALALRDSLRGEGHAASVRGTDYFDAADLEPCDRAVTDDERIAAAYLAAGSEVKPLTSPPQPATPTRTRKR